MKKFLIALGILVLLGIIAIVVAVMNIDRIIRATTEKVMEFVLQVDVSVGSADLNVGEGSITFQEIVISNPAGFQSDRAMRFGLIKAQVDIKSFRTDQPVIHLIQLSEPEITLEVSQSGTNIGELIQNAQRLAPSEEKPAEAPPPDEPEAAQKAFKIDKLIVAGSAVRVAVPFMGGKTYTVKLPDVELTELGGEDGLVTPAEAMQEFLAALLQGIRQAGADILPTEVLSDIAETLKNLPAGIKDSLEQVSQELKDSLGDLEQGLKDVTEDTKGQLDQATEDLKQSAKDTQEKAEESVKDTTDQLQESLKDTTEDLKGTLQDATEEVDKAAENLRGLFGTKKSPTPAPTPAPTQAE